MHDVGAGWLMTSLSPSPILVALIQTAESLPIFLLALPSGAIADVVDRRRLLIVAQSWMFAAEAALAVLTFLNLITPWALLAFTFADGIAIALNSPAWQASTPELVSREDLPAAAALGGVSINVARAVGPAIGGIVVGAVGPYAVFALNAVSYVAVVVAVLRWPRVSQAHTLPKEGFLEAMTAGMRYVRFSPVLRAVVIRTAAFIVFGSALWALLPLIARSELNLSATGFGLLLGCIGIGAVGGAAILPKVRRRVPAESMIIAATLVWTVVMVSFALVRYVPLLALLAVLGGLAWIAVLSSLNVAAQAAVPSWVRGRGLALYFLAFQGGMAGGSYLWGSLATYTSISNALLIASGGLIVGLIVAVRFRLPSIADLDLSPSLHWPSPAVSEEPSYDRGPVLVTVEYRVQVSEAATFAQVARKLETVRRRDGATSWGLFQDTSDLTSWIETFTLETWAEHLRQHARVTVEDRSVEDAVRSLQINGQTPAVRHFVGWPH
jgi:MFS family permease